MSNDPDPQVRRAPKRKSAPSGSFDEDAAKADLRGLKGKCQTWCTGASNKQWVSRGGVGIPLGTAASPKRPSASDKADARSYGMSYGCHSCLKPPSAKWIADHIPPKELSPAQLTGLGFPVAGRIAYRFFPHCEKCASDQASLVKQIKRGLGRALTPDERLQIMDNRAAMSITGQASPANDAQKLDIQQLGTTNGCHVCGGTLPSRDFIADHVPPSEFGTNMMIVALRIMGVRKQPWQLRPHCRTCSNKQGSKVGQLVRQIEEIMDRHGFHSDRGS